MAALWSRMRGRADGESSALADLRKVTESKVTEVPEELLIPIYEASRNEEGRQEIMKHLRECLCEPSGCKWHRVHAALVLIEALLKHGSPAILTETAVGLHFDLVQRLSFLELFEHSGDRRIQHIVRKKAQTLRAELIPRLQAAAETASQEDRILGKDNLSTASGSTAATARSFEGMGDGEDHGVDVSNASQRPVGRQMVIGGVVACGHNDDTTSESEGDDDAPARRRHKAARPPAARKKDISSPRIDVPAPRAPPPVDLLDM